MRLVLTGCAIRDLSALAPVQGLRHLDLSECRDVTDLTPITSLENLRSLDLSGSGVSDIAQLTSLIPLSLDVIIDFNFWRELRYEYRDLSEVPFDFDYSPAPGPRRGGLRLIPR
jgi:hypothetical protein